MVVCGYSIICVYVIIIYPTVGQDIYLRCLLVLSSDASGNDAQLGTACILPLFLMLSGSPVPEVLGAVQGSFDIATAGVGGAEPVDQAIR